MYEDHPVHVDPGFEEDVDKIGRREIESFFASNYTPSRLTLAVVGDVDPSKVRQYAETYWGGWQPQGGGALLPTALGTFNGAASLQAIGLLLLRQVLVHCCKITHSIALHCERTQSTTNHRPYVCKLNTSFPCWSSTIAQPSRVCQYSLELSSHSLESPRSKKQPQGREGPSQPQTWLESGALTAPLGSLHAPCSPCLGSCGGGARLGRWCTWAFTDHQPPHHSLRRLHWT